MNKEKHRITQNEAFFRIKYPTPAEKVKDWYEKDRILFKDNFDISSYNLSQLKK